MLNFQIRGYGIELCAGTIHKTKIDLILNKIRNKKSSLAQIMYNDNWKDFSDVSDIKSSFITNDAELIITSYDSKNYYDDGYSFYRSKVDELIQVPEQIPIKIDDENALIVNKAIYFGCTFEAEISDQDHNFFNETQIGISTISTPLFNNPIINELFLNKLKLHDLKRKKYELMTFQSSIYKKAKKRISSETSFDSFVNAYEIYLDSMLELDGKTE
tara:strand:- start:1236 stop:1883 length:648 start_codon:yes stop_codon:yes gene_type:complete